MNASTELSLTGSVENIVYYSQETGYCVADFLVHENRLKCRISGCLHDVQCGETLRLEGNWHNHPQYGEQFKVSRFSSELPASVHGIRKYLGSGLVNGIGPGIADKIVNHFGESTLRVISEESARLQEIPGIGRGRARAIKEAWDAQQATRSVFLFLKTYGVSNALCHRIVKKYGSQAEAILRHNPYQVARAVPGIGFKTADRIALNLGFPSDGKERIEAGLLFSLTQAAESGHTCLPFDVLMRDAQELLDCDVRLLEAAIDPLLQASDLLEPTKGLFQLPSLTREENFIEEHLERILAGRSNLPSIHIGKAIDWAQSKAGFEFADRQKEALQNALSSKVSILTGGPGTGKTTILRALVEILKAKRVRISLAAPTGRAAQRMAEVTRAYTGTLHRLLKYDPDASGFVHNEDNPLYTDYVVVDESSMLDTRLASAIFRAIPTDAHLLLVGDVFQLPSVGPGQVLRDLIDSDRVPVTRLDNVFRQKQSSGIVRTAHAMLEGAAAVPRALDLAVTPNKRDNLFFEPCSPDAGMEQLIKLYSEILPKRHGVSPDSIQILAPLHRGGAGIDQINRQIQQLNPQKDNGPSLTLGETLFCLGDKVLQTRNNYDKGIFNGDLGRIIDVRTKESELTVEFSGQSVTLERTDLLDLKLAYAISIHKSQGSEFPIVIMPLFKQYFVMLQRTLVYTGLTRGKQFVYMLGEPAAFAMAVQNNESVQRSTNLLK